MTKIRKDFITNPDFDPSKVANASSAAEGLCKWVTAMEMYDRVAKVVAPKKEKMRLAESELKKTVEHLKTKRSQLGGVEERLLNLKQQFQDMLEKKEKLEQQVELCGAKLDRAKRLIQELGGERERWKEAAIHLQKVFNHLLGDILLSSGCIAYLGAYTLPYRDLMIEGWFKLCKQSNIPCSKTFSLNSILGDPVQVQAWTIAGLPNDRFSVDNAVIINNSKKWPLMIDPQGQANHWTKNMEKKLHVIKLTDPDFMRTMENCVTFGNPLLLENVQDHLSPSLEPLLLKQIYKQNGTDMIRLGENVIEYNTDFRFYMTSKLKNPHYLPDLASKVLLLNFMIIQEGLEGQLMAIVVAIERPDLEKERQSLIEQSAENNKQLKDIEDKILLTLSNSQGNILEDETAVEFLGTAKKISIEVSEKQKIALATEKEIEISRQGYRPVAKHSAILYFCVSDLSCIDPMYQYSLSWFINLFKVSITDSPNSKILEKRIAFLKNHFQYNLFENVNRSIFNNHKLIFPFLLSFNILMSNKELDQSELMFFLTGGVVFNNSAPNPAPDWLSSKTWNDLLSLSKFHAFEGFLASFSAKIEEWKRFYISLSVSSSPSPVPGPWNEKLNDFQKLMLLRSLRPDKAIEAVKKFIGTKLGQKFIDPPQFDLGRCYEDSNKYLPLIFILSPGSDPSTHLINFASSKGFGGDKLIVVSLGQGQGPIAEKALEDARMAGKWVLLQNCHLAVSWMSQLERICEELRSLDVHDDFRLWLTSYPSEKFPISVLQNGIKMTNEVATGIKQSLIQSYNSEPINDTTFYNGCHAEKQKIFERLIFGLCFFHALVQERRHFGPQGFNIPYAFNDADLRISLRQLQLFVTDYEEPPFEALTYLTGECNYGGKVTEASDRRLLLTILSDFYHPSILQDNAATAAVVNKSPQGNGGGGGKRDEEDGRHYLTKLLPPLPPQSSWQAYTEYIKQLPSSQDPEIFGMHANTNITRCLQEWQAFNSNLLAVLGSSVVSKSSGQSPDAALLLDIIDDIGVKMDRTFDTVKVVERFPVSYDDSLNTALVQEMHRYNKLTALIRGQLLSLKNALNGMTVMTAEMEEEAASLKVGKVPGVWLKSSYPTLKPLASFVKDLSQRLDFIEKWYEKGKPVVFWLPGFYFVQAFLTGVLQNYARSQKIPIDQLTFDFEIMSRQEPEESAMEGAYIGGLFMDGASWDYEKRGLTEPQDRILYSKLPVVWLRPTLKSNMPANDQRYSCPVYKTSKRFGVLSTTGHSTNFILNIYLPCLHCIKHWTKRGTALLCQLDD